MTMEKMAYEAPQIEIAEIAVEQGFAVSGGKTEDLEWSNEQEW